MNHTSATVQSVVDPVCGMSIDPVHAVATSLFEGTTFHFCAATCKSSFDAAPSKYVAPTQSETASCCTPGGHCSA